MTTEDDTGSDFARTYADRIDDIRELIEVDSEQELSEGNIPSAVAFYWDGMTWLFLPLPGPNELRVEAHGFIDAKREAGMDLILRRPEGG